MPMRFKVPSLRFKKCAKRNPMIRKQSRNCLKSTIAYIGLLKDISW